MCNNIRTVQRCINRRRVRDKPSKMIVRFHSPSGPSFPSVEFAYVIYSGMYGGESKNSDSHSVYNLIFYTVNIRKQNNGSGLGPT